MDFSIVIPVYNNSNTLVELHHALLEKINQYRYNIELIYVEDCSTDNSFEMLIELKAGLPFVKIIQLAYNHSQQVSFHVGMKHAIGKHVIFMSADLQEELSLVDKYIDYAIRFPKVNLFVGYRTENKDYTIFKFLSKLFYRIVRLKIKKIPHNGFDTLCIQYDTLQEFLPIQRTHSFIQAELVKCADEIMEIPYVRLKSSNDKLNIQGLLSKINYFVVCLLDVYFNKKNTSLVKYDIKKIL